MCSEECAGEKRCDNPDTLDPWLLVTCQLSCVNVDVSYPRTIKCNHMLQTRGIPTRAVYRNFAKEGQIWGAYKRGKGQVQIAITSIGLAHVHKSLNASCNKFY